MPQLLGDLTARETAEVLGVGERTVERDWRVARSILHRWLRRIASWMRTGPESASFTNGIGFDLDVVFRAKEPLYSQQTWVSCGRCRTSTLDVLRGDANELIDHEGSLLRQSQLTAGEDDGTS